jgi:hypothetical protein
MVTAVYCVYCQIWAGAIGGFSPWADIAASFPLGGIELDLYSLSCDSGYYVTSITPPFVFF